MTKHKQVISFEKQGEWWRNRFHRGTLHHHQLKQGSANYRTDLDELFLANILAGHWMWWCDEHQDRTLSHSTVFFGLSVFSRCSKINSFCVRMAMLSRRFSMWPTAGSVSASATIRIQSACRMHRWVQAVSEWSHWYITIRCWSSCCPNHDESRYSLAGSKMVGPSVLRM